MKHPLLLLPLFALTAVCLARGAAADAGDPPNPFEGEPNPNLEHAPPAAVPPVPRMAEACDAPESAEAPHPLADGVYWDAAAAVKYRVENGEATVLEDLSLSRSRSALDLPDRLGGAPVAAIGDSAFENCGSLRSVALPDSVREIDVGAFRRCPDLETVAIGAGVTNIAEEAFSQCPRLAAVRIAAPKPRIGRNAFWHWPEDVFRPVREKGARAPAVFEIGGAPAKLRPYEPQFYCGGIIGPEDEEE